MISKRPGSSGMSSSFRRLLRLGQVEPHRNGGAGDHCSITRLLIGHVQPPFNHSHRDLAVRQSILYEGGVDLFGMLHADRDLDLHFARIEPKRSDQRERAVMNRILHGPDRSLGVVAAMQIVAGPHFKDHTLCCHGSSLSSSRTTAAAFAMTVVLVPVSLGISNPPSTTCTVPVPCGSTARTASLSTRSGRGTPIVTSTCIESTGKPTASATLNELCQSASRKARTAAFV